MQSPDCIGKFQSFVSSLRRKSVDMRIMRAMPGTQSKIASEQREEWNAKGVDLLSYFLPWNISDRHSERKQF